MKLMHNWFIVTLLLFSSAGAFAEASPEYFPADNPTGYTFAIVYPLVHPFFESVTEQALRYGHDVGVELIFRAPEGKNVDQQIRMMDELIDVGVDGIALCATDPEALVPSVDKAMDLSILTRR